MSVRTNGDCVIQYRLVLILISCSFHPGDCLFGLLVAARAVERGEFGSSNVLKRH